MSSPSNYREFPPGPSLARLIECFWTSTACATPRTPTFHRVLPDGCMDVLFDFTAVGSRRASVIGTMSRPLIVATSGRVDLLGIRFRPGGLSRFLALDAAELTNARADLAAFWGLAAQAAWHRLGEAASADRIRLLRELLGTHTNGLAKIDPFIHHCVHRIETTRGSVRIGDLEKSTGLGTRQLERKFARHLGISPKTFARVIRFKEATAAAESPNPPEWATLAGELGYADQSHFIREFKAFSGQSPTDFVNESYRSQPNVGFLQDAPCRLD